MSLSSAGGYDGRGRSNDLFLLNVEELRWTHPPANESTPAGRQRHTAVLVQNKKLFVFGVGRAAEGCAALQL